MEEKRNNRALGTQKEELAAAYLIQRGFVIRERNFRCKEGEIDIIGYDEDYLTFVEVKYRSNYAKGGALAAVDYKKQRRICRVAGFYLYLRKKSTYTKARFDVLAIQGDDIIWLKNAFPYMQ